jgi:carbamoyltransferase
MLLRYHAEVGHLYVPNLSARVPHEDGGYFVRTNRLGFRSDWEFDAPRGKAPRIVFLGDSFTAGDGVDNQQRFAEQVGQQLGAEVFNFGVPGTGTDQQLLVFERFASAVNADLVVLCVCVENIERVKVRYRESIDRVTGERILVPKPYFDLENGELLLRHVPVPVERPSRFSVPRDEYQSGSPTRLLSLYRLYHALMDDPRRRELRKRLQRLYGRSRELWGELLGHEPYRDYESEQSRGWQLMSRIVRRLAERAHPVPLLVVPIPTRPYQLSSKVPRYQSLFRSLEDPARGLHVADVTSPLQRLTREERRRLTFPVDPHPSREGHSRLAERIAEDVRQRGLLRSASPAAKTSDAPRTRKTDSTYILGLSAFYHDAAACLIRDGEIVAAAQEERFSRVKNDRRFPRSAVNYCLEQGGIHPDQLRAVAFYDNTWLTFERILHTLLAVGEPARDAWLRIMPSWARYKLQLPRLIRESLRYDGLLLHDSHHRSHAAAAFYPSPFERAAILTIDGVGEWATASIGVGRGREIELRKEMRFANSLGLLYSAFTQFTGFKVNSGEYKMMGLAPYGEPLYTKRILDELVHIAEDGSVELNLEYFGFLSDASMTNEKFAQLFDGPARHPDARLTRREMDIARSIQEVTEEAVLRMARHAHEVTGESRLCLAGGVALNCVANGRVLREGPFEEIWIQPAAGDAGSALGVALDVHYNYFGGERRLPPSGDSMQGGSLLGPAYSSDEITAYLDTHGFPYQALAADERPRAIASLLARGKVVGHFSGRLEFGPRALGARSILGDARSQEMQVQLNLKIKYRESFRPFAPSVLRECAGDYFELDQASPYMLVVAPVREDRRLPFRLSRDEDDMLAIVRQPRSDLPAITHIDYSARIQTVERRHHPAFYDLLSAFRDLTGVGVLVNTSFNVRGEPIVCTPQDAYRCFMRTEMDALVLENCLLLKESQPPWPEERGHIEEHDRRPAINPDDPLVRELDHVFEREFLPLAQRLDHAVGVRVAFGGGSSTWLPHEGPPNRGRGEFEIPEILDRGEGESAALAKAMIDVWRPSALSQELSPLLERLIEIGRRHPAEESLEEEVSDMIYVMF